jgi:hypothetical protein
MKSNEPPVSAESAHVLAADGGIKTARTSVRDPFAALDDLMTVVEALCPTWPPRGAFKKQWQMRL